MIQKQYNKIGELSTSKYEDFLKEYTEELDLLKSRFYPNISTNNFVLDVGCGSCNELSKISSLTKKSYGIDISEKMLRIGKSKHKNLETKVCVAKMDKVPFNNNFFDYILAKLSIHYEKNIENVFLELNRILKPNGKIFLFIAHPLMLYYYKNIKNYHNQENVELPLIDNLIVEQPSHTFEEFLSPYILDNFRLKYFYEAKKITTDIIPQMQEKIPCFMYFEYEKQIK